MKKLIIIGGEGNGTVVASTVEDCNAQHPSWDIIGFLNDHQEGTINNYPILGKVNAETVAPFLEDPDIYFIYTLISINLNHEHLHKLLELRIPKERFATIIHPTAVVSKFAKIGYGVCIQPFVNIGPNVQLDNHIQIFAQAMIGHNAILENYAYVANNACVGARVHLKEGAYLGTNCSTIENISIGRWAVVGMGSVVLKDVSDFSRVVGNPARIIKKVK